MFKEIGVDFNGPIRDEWHASRIALEEKKGLIIPKDKFFGRATIKMGTLFETEDGDERAITVEDWKDANEYIYSDRDRYLRLFRLTERAWESLHLIAACRYRIRIVSNIWSLEEEFVRGLLRKKEIPFDDFFITDKGPKTEHYKWCDAIVENQVKHLLPMNADAHQLILMNGDVMGDLPLGIIPTDSWEESLQYILN